MIAHRQRTSASQPVISHRNLHMQPASHNQQMIASHGHHHHHHHLSQQPGLSVHPQQQPPPPQLNPQMHQQQEQYYVQSAGDLPANQYQQRVTSISNPSADHLQQSTSPYNDHHHHHPQQMGPAEGQPLDGIGQQGQRFRHQQPPGYVVGQHQQSQHQQYHHQHQHHQQASSQPVVVDHQVPQQQSSYQRQQQHYELMPQSSHQPQQPYGQQPLDAPLMHSQQQQQQIMHHQQPQQRPIVGNPRLGPQPPMMTQRISPYQSQQQPPVRQQQQAPAATPTTPSHHRQQHPASNQLIGPPPHHHNQQQYNKPHPQQQMIVRDPQVQGHSLMQSQNNGNNSNQLADHQPISGPFPQQQLSQHHQNHNHNNHQHHQKPSYFMNDNGPQISGTATTTNQVVYAADHHQHHNAHQPSEQQHYLSNSPTLLQQQLNRQPSGHQTSLGQRLGGGRLNGSPPTGPGSNYPPPGPHQASLIGPPMGKIRAGNGRFLPGGEHQIEPPMAEPAPLHPSQVQQTGYRPAGSQPQVVATRGEYYPATSGPAIRAPMHRGRPSVQMQEPMNQAHHQIVGQHPQHILSNPTPPLTPNPNNPASQHHLIGGPPPMPMGPRTTSNPSMSTHQIANQGGNSIPVMGPTTDQPGGQQWHQQAPMGDHLQQPPAVGSYLANKPQPPPGHQQIVETNGQSPVAATTRAMQMPKSNSSSNIIGHHQQMTEQPGPRMQPLGTHQQSGTMMQIPSISEPHMQNQQHNHPTRLTLPLRDTPLLGPFKLDLEAPLTRKVFHLKAQLFESLSKSMNLINPQAAAVVQELQFRSYPVASGRTTTGDSLLASNNNNGNGGSNNNRLKQHSTCQWPEMFQFSINQTIVHLDRSNKLNHKPVDVFQFCNMGDNAIEIQYNNCFNGYEFVLEAVDRPTLKAFMNSCFKSRLLPVETCISKIKFNFGCPGFLPPSQFISQQQATTGIVSEYVSEYHHGVEQTKARISMRCPITGRKMRTPARGQNCKHLQCFDLENFLFANCDKTRWSCPICQLPLPFTLLELDHHQMNILQAMFEQQGSNAPDDVLVDGVGSWQAYQPPAHAPGPMPQQPATAKTTGTYHPQPAARMGPQSVGMGSPQGRPMKTGSGSPAQWEGPGGSELAFGQPVRRPASAMSQPAAPGRRPSNSGSPHLSKRPFAGGPYSGPQNLPPGQYFNGGSANQSDSNQVKQQPPSNFPGGSSMEDLSPLAAMERTIIQQMGPPPFDPESLNASPTPNRGQGAAAGNSLISASSSNQTIASSPSANFSPAGGHGNTASPASRMVPASPQQQPPPQSPMQQQQQQQQMAMQTSTSTPATPSSSMLVHGGPETPATPSNSQQQQQQQQQQKPVVALGGHSPHVALGCTSGAQFGVDHQPLSNGSASAGSITSSSTMTPSGQSLGSVGMGGDSRCGTAPLQTGGSLTGLDEMVNANGSPCGPSMASGQSMLAHNQGHNSSHQSQGQYVNSKLSADHTSDDLNSNDILMGKLMMDSSDMLLRDHRNGNDLALALEEAEWKQQLDKGKSEHLANFLNQEPMLKKPSQVNTTSSASGQQQNQQQQQQQQQSHPNYSSQVQGDSSNRMLSGGLNPSDDEGANQSQGSSPSHQAAGIEHLEFANYLDADVSGETRAGLPPDDIILDLFER